MSRSTTPPNTPPHSGNTTPTSSNTTDISGNGYNIQITQVVDASGSETTAIFTTTDPTSDVQISENLFNDVEAYYDDASATTAVMDEIKLYASKIQCTDFHGKGTIDDYTALFEAASRIANESQQMQLDVDVEGFNEFGAAAEQLSQLFSSFILRLENVSIIDDTAFLTAVASALKKIWELSEVFGRFKATILATSTIQIPKSARDARVILDGVMGEVNCAMQYITHFADPSASASAAADLSAEEREIINKAVATIDNWNTLCEQGVSIAMSTNVDIQLIGATNSQLKTTANTLKNSTNLLKTKLANFHLSP